MPSLVRLACGLLFVAATVVTGVIGLSAATAGPAGAVSIFTVTDAGDGTPVPSNCTLSPEGDCTLRAALEAAESQPGNVTIDLPPPTSLEFPGPSYVVSSGLGQLDIDDDNVVSIVGAGASTTAIAAQCAACSVDTRVFEVDSDANIYGVTIEGGNPASGNGGGILDEGNLMLTSSTVTGNTAALSGGGVELAGGGSATLTDDTIEDNSVPSADNDAGGGIAVANQSDSAPANLTLDDTTVEDNSVQSSGGLGEANGGGLDVFNALSGADLDPNLTVDIDGSTIGANSVVSGDGAGAGINAYDGTWDVTNSTIQDNVGNGSGTVDGGGLFLSNGTLASTFAHDTFSGNGASSGGGVFVEDGNATFSDDVVSGNNATDEGAGILDETDDASIVTVDSSTINGNVTTGSADDVDAGGGVTSDGCNDLTLTNDTIADNSAPDGGGYYSTDCGDLGGPDDTDAVSLDFDTISDNSTSDDGGGGNIQLDEGTATAADSIVAGGVVGPSTLMNCAVDAGAGAALTSNGYNLFDDDSCGTAASTDIVGRPAELGTLGANGGPTHTELPGATSPAVGAIPASVCAGTGVTTDQRAEPRGQGAYDSCTIGAVEVAQRTPAPPVPPTPPTPPPYNANGYRLVGDEGGIFDFGLNFDGSLAGITLNAPIIGLANAPGPNGYLMVASDGGVFAEGGANFYGSLGGRSVPSPIAAIAAPPSETGYWLVAQDGAISSFGSVAPLPSLSLPPGARIVGMASTTNGTGAWLTDQLGDVYALGSAAYEGGLGGQHLNAPIVGIAAAASGQGYVLVGSDGGVYTYGTQGFFGSVPGSLAPGQTLSAPIIGIAVTHSGNGYWEVGSDGGVFTYGDAPFLGSIYTALPGQALNGPIVGIQHLGVPAT